jgi:5-methylcytosine-specific restriction endonuclease McrA
MAKPLEDSAAPLKETARKRAWAKAHPEYQRAYRLAHKEERAAYQRTYTLAHKEKRAAYIQKWYKANKKSLANYKHAWHLENKTKRATYMRTFQQERKSEIAEYKKQWYKDNPTASSRTTAQRRAAKKGARITESVDRSVVFERDEGFCGICYTKVDSDDWHLDHVVPLSRGGDHSYDNCQVSHPTCNLRKGTSLG